MPKASPSYDDVYLEHVNKEVTYIDYLAQCDPVRDDYTIDEVTAAIDKLNCGKAPDENGVVAEHLKLAKPVIAPILVNLLNQIRELKHVPKSLKSGVITPVGKKGKDLTRMENYRGISITSLLGKVLEHILLARKPCEQSVLQFGFTAGLSPKMATVILHECIVNARESKELIYVCTLDAVKAFDTVSHASMLRKLYYEGLDLESWAVIQSLYDGMTAKAKWRGCVSSSVDIEQGVRQGGVLSPSLYKSYINGLLSELEASGRGLCIGTTFVGSPGVVDDIMCVTFSPEDMQSMLNIANRYASNKEIYEIHPVKSDVTQFEIGRAHV
jgi:hypothetical protein